MSLIGIYLIGRWIKMSQWRYLQLDKWWYFGAYIVLGLILAGISAILLKLGVTQSIYGYLNPVIIVNGVLLFLFFKNWNIGHIKWINWIAASAFAAYLFHHNPAIYPYYLDGLRDIKELYQCALLWSMLYICVFFAFAIIVDKLRILIFNCASKLFQHRSL